MSEDRSVEEIAHEVLMRQAKARTERTGESIEEAIEAVLNTEAGAQLRQLRDVPHDEESIEEWRAGMAREGSCRTCWRAPPTPGSRASPRSYAAAAPACRCGGCWPPSPPIPA